MKALYEHFLMVMFTLLLNRVHVFANFMFHLNTAVERVNKLVANCPTTFYRKLVFYCSPGCPNATFGSACREKCHCMNNATCEPVNGKCYCPAGFTGEYCEGTNQTPVVHRTRVLCRNLLRYTLMRLFVDILTTIFHMFSLPDLCFVLCSRDLDVLSAQRMMGFLFLFLRTHKSTGPENPVTWRMC